MSTIKPGDIIYADRTVYKHYGVYVDKNTVIHYATDDGSLDSERAYVHKTTPKKFADGDTVYRLNFPDNPAEWESTLKNLQEVDSSPVVFPSAGIIMNDGVGMGIGEIFRDIYEIGKFFFGKDDEENPRLYSPQETIERAESRLGERGYDLLFDNCEHFAIWCKTGLSRSTQIEGLINVFENTDKLLDVIVVH